MDPNANLKEQREIVSFILSDEKGSLDGIFDALRLVELVHAMDEWLSRGGFLPKAWETKTGEREDPDEVEPQERFASEVKP